MRCLFQPPAFAILLASASMASAEPPFESKAICRAAMAAITGRDVKLFQATDAPDGTIALTYARSFDNFVWAYHCRLEGNRVIWADEPGRWRQDAKDDKILFESVGGGTQLRITKTPVPTGQRRRNCSIAASFWSGSYSAYVIPGMNAIAFTRRRERSEPRRMT